MSAVGLITRRRLRGSFSRTLAILFATLLAAGGLTATGAFSDSLRASLGREVSAPVSSSDVVASDVSGADAAALAADIPGVEAAESLVNGAAMASTGNGTQNVSVSSTPDSPSLRWLQLDEGALPADGSQFVTTASNAQRLGLVIGQSISLSPISESSGPGPGRGPEGRPGPAAEGGPAARAGSPAEAGPAAEQHPRAAPRTVTLVGLVSGPGTGVGGQTLIFLPPATAADFGAPQGAIVAVGAGTSASTVATQLQERITAAGGTGDVSTTSAFLEDALAQLGAINTVIVAVILAFMLIALVAAVMVIRNTLQVLLAQRMREFGLLRLVGASGAQVRSTVLREALLVAGAGSVLGIVLGYLGAVLLTSMNGMVVVPPPVIWCVAAIVVALVTTLIAALAPAAAASRLKPIEALQAAATTDHAERRSTVAAWVVGISVTVIGAAALVFAALITQILLAVPAGFVLAVGLIVLVPQLVRVLLPVITAVLRRSRPAARLAGENLRRSSRRAGAIVLATALGGSLVVAMLTAVGSMMATLTSQLDNQYPVDAVVSMQTGEPLPADVISSLTGVSDVSRSAQVRTLTASGEVSGGGLPPVVSVIEVPDAWHGEAERWRGRDSAGTALIPELSDESGDASGTAADRTTPSSVPVSLTAGDTTIELDALPDPLASALTSPTSPGIGVLVDPATFAGLGGTPEVTQLWLDVTGGTSTALSDALATAQGQNPDLVVTGALPQRQLFEQIGTIMTTVLLGMLALTVVISAVGLASVVSLSVAERRHEIGLLRALGMTRGSVRSMVLIESVTLALVGAVFSVAIGLPLGIAATAAMPFGQTAPVIVIPWLGLLLVAAVATALGLIAGALPARGAARIAPAVALARD